jgi:hypothetical protein
MLWSLGSHLAEVDGSYGVFYKELRCRELNAEGPFSR